MCVTSVTEFQISVRFALCQPFLCVTGNFEKGALNDPQMTLNHIRTNVPYIHTTTTPESRISLRFALRPPSFETQAILRQVYRMPPQMTLKPTMPMVLGVTSIFDSQISVCFAPRPALFKISHNLSLPIDYHVNRPKKEEKKIAKNSQIQISQFC